MVAKAKTKFIRISPFKVRRIANEVKNKPVVDVECYLEIMPNKGAKVLKKVIHSAKSNLIKLNSNIDEESIKIKKILVNQGPTLKRFQPISRGRANRILKRTSHIEVEVSTD